ncbi:MULTISPECIES: PTS sugar transporter subunit IIA [Oerskovia]|uniref:PTS glucose transporter subunit IIA n=2 Tax=Oerskovia TaxID=162491 RepID=A0ABR8UY20_9CELL|nr:MULTISPECIES: PTS glucose transporter subunit IIA [Oerskovia]MBD7997435.1 PTS glucose transporter subunit IIA [Oerskovia gallyi]MBM7496877.1 PTS system glucose-specific IIA component/PTS system N-acetylglucosamine-specific IIA component [Oerskovia paurometabola]
MPPTVPPARAGSSTDEPVLRVGAPLSGTVVALADVPDPVFAQSFAGPGLAIEPAVDPDGIATVVAPAAGTVGSLFPHAFALEASGGRTILVHLGIDTVRLGGEGFQLHVEPGDRVEAGTTLLSWEPPRVAALGLSTLCSVIALQGDPSLLTLLVEPGRTVGAGEPVLSWT